MIDEKITKLCALHIFEGLSEGLSHFSGPSRVAVIFAGRAGDSMRIHDPQNLLRGHEPKLKEFYLKSSIWRSRVPVLNKFFHQLVQPQPEKNPELTGLISFGGKASTFFYQMWFTEHHPDMCSIGPTQCWLEHAVWLLTNENISEKACYIGSSGYVLREYATHAVRDFIVDQMNLSMGMDVHTRVYPILDAILAISKTVEEGARPKGRIEFIEPRILDKVRLLARFPQYERPGLDKYKHVAKLLQASAGTERCLISDGHTIVGVGGDNLPDFRITADFKGKYGFLNLNRQPICSFYDGGFHSSTLKAKMVHLEEILLESAVESTLQHTLFQIICSLVHHAQETQHGASLVIDFNITPLEIPGQDVEEPLDLQEERMLALTKSLLILDGALHIGAMDLKLYRFACILDGSAILSEDRARGARFNSALRFTAEHTNLVIVVISADRPVSVIQEGVELNAQCEWQPVSACVPSPPTLEEWLRSSPE